MEKIFKIYDIFVNFFFWFIVSAVGITIGFIIRHYFGMVLGD